MDIWVIQATQASQATPLPLKDGAPASLPSLNVSRLQARNNGWCEMEAGEWTQLAGTPEFLTSLQLPETRVVLALPSPPSSLNRMTAFTTEWCWADLQSGSDLRFTSVEPWHRTLSEQVLAYGKPLTICFDAPPDVLSQQDGLMALTAHEARVLMTAGPLNTKVDTPPLITALHMITHPSALRSRLRLGALAVTLALGAVTWHTLPTWVSADQQLHQNKLLSQLADSQNPPMQPDWEAAQVKLGKFGRDHRANLKAVRWMWNAQGEILIEGQLNRPRQRLPKDCLPIEEGWIQCPIIESKAMP